MKLNFHGSLEPFFANFMSVVNAESNSVGLGSELRLCITNKLPGGTNATELWSTL